MLLRLFEVDFAIVCCRHNWESGQMLEGEGGIVFSLARQTDRQTSKQTGLQSLPPDNLLKPRIVICTPTALIIWLLILNNEIYDKLS